jgi:imidazolonepropionase-like amidohydrolase
LLLQSTYPEFEEGDVAAHDVTTMDRRAEPSAPRVGRALWRRINTRTRIYIVPFSFKKIVNKQDLTPTVTSRWAICGAAHAVTGQALDVEIEAGAIHAVLPAGGSGLCAEQDAVPAAGRWLCPAFIDSHVHIAYYSVPELLAAEGVAAAVDMGAPLASISSTTAPLRVLWAGPMITAVGGYPTQSWGAGGYGIEVADVDAARAAVDQVHAAGAAFVKIPMAGPPDLSDAQVAAIVTRAHEVGLRVAVHVLDNARALRAAQLGVDLLAHAPTQALDQTTLEAWRGRAVVATVTAFSNSATTRHNLMALAARDVAVLYGTDFGNTRDIGIQVAEIQAMLTAGLSMAEIIAAGTSTAADYWGLSDLGRIAVGARASLLLLDADPVVDPTTPGRPARVFIDGIER